MKTLLALAASVGALRAPLGATSRGAALRATVEKPVATTPRAAALKEKHKAKAQKASPAKDPKKGVDKSPKSQSGADECPFCFEHSRDTALIPCGHVLCSMCVEASCPTSKKQKRVCPVCRQPVTQTMRVFL